MTDSGKRWLIEQRGNDHRRGDYSNGDYYDELDERRGVRGSGRGDRANGNDMARGDRTSTGHRDFEDMADYHMKKAMKLTKSDINKWKHNMENSDGSKGEHYDMDAVIGAAEKLGVRFNHFDEREFCIAVNMIYSDYGHIIKRLVQDKEKELLVCADFAKAFLDDPDGPEPSEKLAIYYHCIASGE
jgi:hypothetical protein